MAILEKNRQLKQQLESSVKRHRKSYRRHRSREAVYKGQKEQLLQETEGRKPLELTEKNSGKESCRRRFKTQRTDCGSFIPHRRSMSVSVRTCKKYDAKQEQFKRAGSSCRYAEPHGKRTVEWKCEDGL